MAVDSFTGIGTTPIHAKLYVNGKIVATTPYSALWFKAGDLIKIEKEGYETIQFILSLPQVGTELTFFLTPAPTPAKTYGDVQVKSSPTNAKVYVDRRNTGKTTPALLTLETGLRTITLKKDGYLDLQWVETIRQESRVLSTKFLTQVPIPAPAPAPAPAPVPIQAPETIPEPTVRTKDIVGQDLKRAIADGRLWDVVKLTYEYLTAPMPVPIAEDYISLMLGFMSFGGGAKFIDLFDRNVDDAVKIVGGLNIEGQAKLVRELVKSGKGINALNYLIRKEALNLAMEKPAISAIDAAVKGMIRGSSLMSLKEMLPWLGAAVAVMGTVNFIEFLYEEMLQTQGMGIYVAIANKQWAVAKETLDKARGNLEKATWVYTNIGWLAPYAWDVFKSYAAATKLQYDSYEKVINSKLAYAKAPDVFNKANFEEDVKKKEVPVPEDLVEKPVEEKKEEMVEVITPEEKKKEVPIEVPEAPAVAAPTLKEFYEEIGTYVVGTLRLTRKEWEALGVKYNLSQLGEVPETARTTQDLYLIVGTYVVGRAVLTEKEWIALRELVKE